MTDSGPNNVQRFYLHYLEGHRAYIVIVDSQRRPFDFSDNNFKSASKLATLRDACLYATGRHEERADHAYSYSVEFDLARLLAGSNPETVPAEGSVISIHWLVQAGEEPDVKVDHRHDGCRLRLVSGSFEPIDTSSRDQLDESIAFEKRARFGREYGEFIVREIDIQDVIRARLAEAVRAGDVSKTLRVLADDLCYWAGNLKQHLLHHVSHLAKDPSFVRMRDVPEDAPFRIYETWILRSWIGSHEAFDLLEFHKGAEYARSFSARLDRLHEARAEFAKLLIQYTVRTRGEDAEGIFALDEIRKDLKHQALWLAEHLDRIATQFDVERVPRDPAPTPVATTSNVPSPAQSDEAEPRPFTGGEMVFYRDRVEFCGVDICSGPRTRSKRVLLELLSKRNERGEFAPYSGEDLEAAARQVGVTRQSNGWIRDVRIDIMERLRTQAKPPIVSKHDEVILSLGPGYRFAECVGVRFVDKPAITDITDIDDSEDVPDDDVRDAFDVPDDATARRAWILQQLANGVEMKAPMVADQFKCSVKTAQRDLTMLKDEGKVEFVGAPRTGFYRLRQQSGV